jgi:hypothetical protein
MKLENSSGQPFREFRRRLKSFYNPLKGNFNETEFTTLFKLLSSRKGAIVASVKWGGLPAREVTSVIRRDYTTLWKNDSRFL